MALTFLQSLVAKWSPPLAVRKKPRMKPFLAAQTPSGPSNRSSRRGRRSLASQSTRASPWRRTSRPTRWPTAAHTQRDLAHHLRVRRVGVSRLVERFILVRRVASWSSQWPLLATCTRSCSSTSSALRRACRRLPARVGRRRAPLPRLCRAAARAASQRSSEEGQVELAAGGPARHASATTVPL